MSEIVISVPVQYLKNDKVDFSAWSTRIDEIRKIDLVKPAGMIIDGVKSNKEISLSLPEVPKTKFARGSIDLEKDRSGLIRLNASVGSCLSTLRKNEVAIEKVRVEIDKALNSLTNKDMDTKMGKLQKAGNDIRSLATIQKSLTRMVLGATGAICRALGESVEKK